MNRHDDLDRLLSAWLDDPLTPPAPRYLDTVLERTRRTRQRPAWASSERWLPMTLTLRNQGMLIPVRPATLGLVLLPAVLLTMASLPFLAGTLLSPTPEETSTGGLIAFDRDGDIYVVDSPDGEPRLLIGGPTEDIIPIWSPDGQRLLFLRDEGLMETLLITDAEGRTPVVVNAEPLPDIQGAVWSPDSSMVAVTYGDGLRALQTMSVFAGDGSGEVALDGSQGEPRSGAEMPAWRPATDGNDPHALLYKTIEEPPRLMLADEDVRDDPEVILNAGDIDGGRYVGSLWQYDFLWPEWAPDGRRFAYHTLQDVGEAAPLDGNGFRVHVARPADGRVPARDTRIEYDPMSDDEFGVRWSPDGTRIAFQAYDAPWTRLVLMDLSNDDDLVVSDPVVTQKLGSNDWHGLAYAWAPDGTGLVMVRLGSPDREAYFVDASSGELQALDWNADGDPSWQPAGT